MTTENQDIAKANLDNAKKEYKNMSTFEKIMLWLVRLGTITIAVVATLFLYVWKEPCDIDQTNAWCHTHPFSTWDFIGTVLFYIGAVWLGGIGPWIAINVFGMDEDQDTQKPLYFISGGLIILGFALIWAL